MLNLEAKMEKDNMYPWVTRTRNYIGGECPHKCVYCYVNTLKQRFRHVKKRYTGEPFLITSELEKSEGQNNVIFVQDCGDLFAEAIPDEWIKQVLEHCRAYPSNMYLFQSKNPMRFFHFTGLLPQSCMLGTTMESDISYPNVSRAPSQAERALAMSMLKGFQTMISVEPVMDFNLHGFVKIIRDIHPKFVSIGADSKRCSLKEPDRAKLVRFIDSLREFTEVRTKKNLRRILDG
jgi:DNA repair photolyase